MTLGFKVKTNSRITFPVGSLLMTDVQVSDAPMKGALPTSDVAHRNNCGFSGSMLIRTFVASKALYWLPWLAALTAQTNSAAAASSAAAAAAPRRRCSALGWVGRRAAPAGAV